MRSARSISLLSVLFLVLASTLVIGEDLAVVQSPPPPAVASVPAVLSGRDLLRRALDLLEVYDFPQAESLLIDSLGLSSAEGTKLRSWLSDYQQFLAERRVQRQVTSQEHIAKAHTKLAAGEFQDALAETFLAVRVSPDPDALRAQDWLTELVDRCAVEAQEYISQGQYTKAAIIFQEISSIFPDEPSWKERVEQAGLQAGMVGAYGENSDWQQRLRDVDTHDFESAVALVDRYYVKPVNHRKMLLGALRGLRTFLTIERLQKSFSSLADKQAVVSLLDSIDEQIQSARTAPNIDAADVIRVYWQIIYWNRQGLRLPDAVLVDLFSTRAFAAIDDYTEMIWPEQQEWFSRTTMGSFSGIGVQIKLNVAKQLEVVTPLEGTPALKAGLQAADLIVAVDGRSTEGISINEAVRRITGRKGTKVLLTIRRPGRPGEFNVSIVRDVIRIDSVRGYDRLPGNGWNYIIDDVRKIAYVRISNFTSNTSHELDQAIDTSRKQGARALILDLRFDPGGTLAGAEDVSDRFLPPGRLIVSTSGRRARNYEARTERPDSCAGWPVVVLASERSASAAEIVAGALQDHDRAFVVGERTFGKGLVQRPLRLRPISNSQVSIKLTTAYWYLPKGRNVQRSDESKDWGVLPDFAVDLTLDETRSLTSRWASAAIIRPAGVDSPEGSVDNSSPPSQAQPTESDVPESDDDSTAVDEPEPEPKDLPDPQLQTALLVARLELLVDSH
ncbi:MAG: PDZ domain-containing protein [Actinobacteria bacterium]|nr:PDZ domain-containing protein [Actinomycetota bacterium]